MSTSLTYNVQVNSGSSTTTIADVTKGVTGLGTAFQKIGTAAFAFNNISQSIGAFSNELQKAVAPGDALDSSLQDLKAITGATDSQLQQIKGSARETAKAFGVDAAGGVESYKLLLSQLSPELAKAPVALSAMGKNVAILSKQLSGDTAAAASILTTAMNQYGVSLDNPIEATRTQAAMMNIMSAAAKEGSAELPQIKSALEQAGMMAKTFNVSFAETNSAIQVLDKAGKKGAEGGVAIRNILAEMGLGAKQPKQVADGLKEMGIDLNKLSDQSLTFSQRLDVLKPALNNQALLTQLFGKENVAAAIALIQGTDQMDKYTTAIVGTNTANEMAGVVMDSYKEKMNRVWATVKDFGISLFDSMRPVLPAIQVVGSATMVLANMGGMMNSVSIIANSTFGQAIGKAATASWGFVRSLFASAISLIRTGVQFALTGAMMLGGFVTSTITATAAQLGLNIAMTANPIGLIVVGIAAAVGAIVLLVKHWDWIKQKIMDFGKWVYDHSPFKFLIDVVDKIFPGFKQKMSELWDFIVGKFEKLVGWLKDAFGWIKKLFHTDTSAAPTEESVLDYGAQIQGIPGVDMPYGDASLASSMFNPAMFAFEQMNAAQKNEAIAGNGSGTKEIKDTASNIASGGNKPTNIYVTVGKFQDKTEIHSSSAMEGVDELLSMMEERFYALLNSANTLAAR